MPEDSNENYWREQLKHAEWYIRLQDYLSKQVRPISKDPDVKKKRHKFYETVESMLEANEIPLAKNGPDFDKERKPIDTIIIHHTTEEPDIRLSKLSAIGFVRQYGMKYLDGKIRGNNVSRQPIWSGHFRNGKMVFFAYHWLIRPDGGAERILEDKNIGWQSGDWDINRRSVAISLSGDLSYSNPSEAQIASIRKIINENYSQVDSKDILGHREINPKTTCPGNKFLGDKGWKSLLI